MIVVVWWLSDGSCQFVIVRW